MSLKSSLIALAENIGMCQENSRSIKQALAGGLVGVATNAPGIDGASEFVKLWVNETPTTAFTDQAVNIDDGDLYDGYYIIIAPTSGTIIHQYYIDKTTINDSNNHTIAYTSLVRSSGKIQFVFRDVSLSQVEGSHSVTFTFGKGRKSVLDTYGTASSTTDSNSDMIPQYIIGIKF